ncbi:hypothetical protein GALMADRAFT_139841 [Galerina marginata CBS 339.88]|uniref:Uncharacterized protein n=1 Tax=Galerina marginata (strain CBS 339.88) TaxID=685588 RepID=A0A067SYY4_GALM3|nr:hypothetical protein GALMADRAFT_139841 [Galerina marginata CBS 339.88]
MRRHMASLDGGLGVLQYQRRPGHPGACQPARLVLVGVLAPRATGELRPEGRPRPPPDGKITEIPVYERHHAACLHQGLQDHLGPPERPHDHTGGHLGTKAAPGCISSKQRRPLSTTSNIATTAPTSSSTLKVYYTSDTRRSWYPVQATMPQQIQQANCHLSPII